MPKAWSLLTTTTVIFYTIRLQLILASSADRPESIIVDPKDCGCCAATHYAKKTSKYQTIRLHYRLSRWYMKESKKLLGKTKVFSRVFHRKSQQKEELKRFFPCNRREKRFSIICYLVYTYILYNKMWFRIGTSVNPHIFTKEMCILLTIPFILFLSIRIFYTKKLCTLLSIQTS